MENDIHTLVFYFEYSPLSKDMYRGKRRSEFLLDTAKIMQTPLYQLLNPNPVLQPSDYVRRAEKLRMLEGVLKSKGKDYVIP